MYGHPNYNTQAISVLIGLNMSIIKQEGKICIICVDMSDHLHNFIIMKGTHKTPETDLKSGFSVNVKFYPRTTERNLEKCNDL